jgi:hypothetical protein
MRDIFSDVEIKEKEIEIIEGWNVPGELSPGYFLYSDGVIIRRYFYTFI